MLSNLVVVLALATLQVVVLIAVAALRVAIFHITASGAAWFVAASVLFTVFMYGVAETLAARIPHPEEYIGATPVVAILPFFFAGALFPIHVLPGALAALAKFLPLTHALALMRYGFVDHRGSGLHDIWGMSNTTTRHGSASLLSSCSQLRSSPWASAPSSARPSAESPPYA